MSWLDDMEAADAAYPDPDADPWAPPGHVPGPAVRQRAGEAERATLGYQEPPPGLSAHVNCDAAERWAQQQPAGRAFTVGEAYQVAEDAVGLFLEYRDTHGRPEGDARTEALGEVAQGLHAWHTVGEALTPYRTVGPDWRALQAAEAQARDAGLRVTVPRLGGQESPEYQADAAAWGSGRGIGPDGPEVS